MMDEDDRTSGSAGIRDVMGVRNDMLVCAQGMLDFLRQEVKGDESLLDELDTMELKLRIMGVRR